jgi:hypothetical protein
VRPEFAAVRALPATVRTILADPDAGRALVRRAAEAAVRDDHADVLFLGLTRQDAFRMPLNA